MINKRKLVQYLAGVWIVGMSVSVVDLREADASLGMKQVENDKVNKLVYERLLPKLSAISANVELLVDRQNVFLVTQLRITEEEHGITDSMGAGTYSSAARSTEAARSTD